jgi:hypothetical protein
MFTPTPPENMRKTLMLPVRAKFISGQNHNTLAILEVTILTWKVLVD